MPCLGSRRPRSPVNEIDELGLYYSVNDDGGIFLDNRGKIVESHVCWVMLTTNIGHLALNKLAPN